MYVFTPGQVTNRSDEQYKCMIEHYGGDRRIGCKINLILLSHRGMLNHVIVNNETVQLNPVAFFFISKDVGEASSNVG